ncbi:nitroreductase family deazaflavin-dependent oxidoreductase [Mycobacterium sp. CVI_P3]|uniref:Nitroreductase family deazaflavin-dependent oxidoreductase n=1 Tax=Mycobacterium pinniadriaticum TaxID=2994102 RepID=A0ABT3SN23_9MYCO|nr:nitroreductase family deazaflavin-dependent oxidoreductase [Mycobacterium pinniadriaticum]MCX2934495.1 nitroreductase family deazaflavin-dependent oxidoreductase [Mycobacterium pinniadriaticum]MCX2940919.1 nitroreductase family deazaflavin-dependent oxidoreductase [Mycobacterium pinniadriaticum]
MSQWSPGRVTHALFRAPAWFYGHGLGWLLTGRMLCLTHVGRRYRTVLEVVGRRGDEIYVVAGWGSSSDWYRNIQATPPVEVASGRRAFVPAWRRLDAAEAEVVIADYERRNRLITPVVRLGLSKLVGWRYDGTPAARERLVSELPLLGFRPR